MLCQMSKQTKRHKYPELFKFDEMTDVLDDFDSVWCNVKSRQVDLKHTSAQHSLINLNVSSELC